MNHITNKTLVQVTLVCTFSAIAFPALADYCIFRLNPQTKIVEQDCRNMIASPNKEEVAALRQGLAKECVVESLGTGPQRVMRRYCR